jgi:O-antigen/teichoic acid export membrane protein
MRDKVLRSIGWLAVRYGARQGANTVLFFVFALLLTPTEFGIGSIAVAAGLLLRQLLERGFRDVVVANATPEPMLSDTAWWASAIAGCLVATALFAAAPLLAETLGQPELVSLLRAGCLIPLIAGLATVQEGRIERAFRQKTLAMAQGGASLLSLGVGVWLALSGLGASAMVWAAIVEMAAASLLALSIARWWPGRQVDMREMRRQIRFAWPLMLSALMGGGAFRIAQIVIGAVLGPVATAQFRVGMQIYMLLVQLICAPVIVTLLPAFSQARDRIETHFKDGVGYYALLAFPVFLGAGVVAPLVLTGVLGPDWTVAAGLSRIFALIVFTYVATDVLLPALIAKGAPGVAAFVQISGVFVGLGLMVLGAAMGLEAAVWGYVARAIYAVPLSLWLAHRHLGARPVEILERASPYAVCAMLMASMTWIVAIALEDMPGLAIGACVVFGASCYAGLVRWGIKGLFPKAYAPLKRHMPGRISRLL